MAKQNVETDQSIAMSINDFAREMSTRLDTPLLLLEVYRKNNKQRKASFESFKNDFKMFCDKVTE